MTGGPFQALTRRVAVLALPLLLAACGGGGSGGAQVNQPPIATITSPAADATFRAGESLTFTGSGTDAEDGALGSGQVQWWADLHHDDHTHPLQAPTAGGSGSFTFPTRNETSDNIWVRFHFRVTDSAGQSVEVTRDVQPRKSTFTLATDPPGLQITLDGLSYPSPKVVTGVVGIERELIAADQLSGGKRYRFTGWSQGGAAEQTVSTADADATYTASFAEVPNVAPAVALSAPATATVGVAATLTANASDSDGAIVSVDFFDGSTLLATVTTAPYTLAWAPASASMHSLTARATDDAGASTTSAAINVSVSLPPNVAPTVSLTAPASATRGVATTLSATAGDTDGTVTQVDFFEGTALLGTDTTSPYSAVWTPAAAGTSSLTARATDDRGGTTTSHVASVTVVPPPNVAPTVTLSAPGTGTVGVTVALAAAAADSDGTVTTVEFFDGALLIFADTSAPYGGSWAPATPGAHNLTARATDNQGAVTVSPIRVVDVSPPNNVVPTVSLGAPATAALRATVTLTAIAADSDGTVAKVEFFDGSTLIAADTTSPYAASWSPQTPGVHSLTARATDNTGATATTAATAVIVTNASPTVTLSAATSGTVGVAITLTATAADSDGAVAKVEFFDGAALVGTDTAAPHSVSWVPASAGAHSLTARATDDFAATATSAVVNVTVAAPPNMPPAVTLGAPATATLGALSTLSATASDSDGTVASVQFFEGATLIGTDTTSPFNIAWTPGTAGTRSLSARATDNAGAVTTSAAVAVTVQTAADTQAPTATFTAPANLTDNLNGTITLTASATDNVGVAGVEFQIDGVMVGSEDTTAPYSVSFDTLALASGQHVLRARARDAAGSLSPWSTATVRFGGTRVVPAGFTRDLNWLTGLTAATSFTQAPDGRLFVALQDGRLVVVKNGALLATPFVNLTVDSFGERGLIGVTLHPNFASNGFVYVYYTRVNGSARNNRVSRFVANGDVSTGAETVIVDLPNLSSAGNHNGGAMNFGADGKLYVAVGDNAAPSRAQNLNDPFGKMLRFNPDGSIPADNPFCTTAEIKCAVWAYGLRNPFTFAIQPGTGRIHINDVGQDTWEEINLGAARANYGWGANSEGPCNVPAGVAGPIFAYKHDDTNPPCAGPGGFFTGVAIVGGTFYPQTGNFPVRYRGKYFFLDLTSQWLAVLDSDNGNTAYAFGQISGLGIGVLVGTDGALYVLSQTSIQRFTTP